MVYCNPKPVRTTAPGAGPAALLPTPLELITKIAALVPPLQIATHASPKATIDGYTRRQPHSPKARWISYPLLKALPLVKTADEYEALLPWRIVLPAA